MLDKIKDKLTSAENVAVFVLARVLAFAAPYIGAHIAVQSFLGSHDFWDKWAEPVAVCIVVMAQAAWSWWRRRQNARIAAAEKEKAADVSKSAVRIVAASILTGKPIGEVSEAAIAAVPDSLHDRAVAEVKAFNKNGGVPAPAMV